MRELRRVAWILPCVVLIAAGASAQDAVSPLPGVRLRITAPELARSPIIGSLAEITAHDIVLTQSPAGRTAIPRAGVSRVELSQGRRGHAWKGLLVGSVAGAAVLPVLNAQDPETGELQEYVVVALVGAGLGALSGAGIGALIRTERWAELPAGDLRVTARATPHRGVSLGLAWTW